MKDECICGSTVRDPDNLEIHSNKCWDTRRLAVLEEEHRKIILQIRELRHSLDRDEEGIEGFPV